MAARFRVPASFTLGSLKFTAREMPAAELHKFAGGECYGLFIPDKQEIIVTASRRGLSEALRAQTFYHELGHALLWTIGSKDYENEKAVDALGHALKQFMETREYE